MQFLLLYFLTELQSQMKRIYMHNLTDECLKKSSMILMNTTKNQINVQKSEILHQEIFNWILVFEAKSKLKFTEEGLNKDKGVLLTGTEGSLLNYTF